MGNGKITKELKGLGTKINDKEPSGETVSEVIKGISDDFTGLKILEVSNITGLTTEQCEALNVGDVVVKLTSNQKHTYTVSYKETGVGMCLTYVDATTSETVSYDYVDSAWVYNSTDITPLNVQSDWNEADTGSLAFIKNKPTIPSANHLYKHDIVIGTINVSFTIFDSTNNQYNIESLTEYFKNNNPINVISNSMNEIYQSIHYEGMPSNVLRVDKYVLQGGLLGRISTDIESQTITDTITQIF